MNSLEWAKVIVQGIGAIAWPCVVVWAAWYFRRELTPLLARVRKIEAPGFKLETAELAEKTAEVKVNQYPDPSEAVEYSGESGKQLVAPEIPDVFAHVSPQKVALVHLRTATNLEKSLIEAASSARGTAVTVRHLVESELRHLLAATGYLSRAGQRTGTLTINELLEEAGRSKLLSPELVSTIREFRALANRMIHSDADEQDATAELTAAGLNILAALRSIPREKNIVAQPNVPIFSDEQCTVRAEGHGLILNSYVPSGMDEPLVRRIYPTTKGHYQKGKEVAWEWDGLKRWGPCWYRDPNNDDKITLAWSASMEFVGRHLEDI